MGEVAEQSPSRYPGKALSEMLSGSQVLPETSRSSAFESVIQSTVRCSK